MILKIDPRLALIAYAVLVLASAGPIVVAWLALLPQEREPFAAPREAPATKPRDGFAIFLLANITLSVLLRVPGAERGLRSLVATTWIAPDTAQQALMFALIWFGFVPGLAAAYSAVRTNPIRLPLLAGGMLTLALWFLAPWLFNQIAASP